MGGRQQKTHFLGRALVKPEDHTQKANIQQQVEEEGCEVAWQDRR